MLNKKFLPGVLTAATVLALMVTGPALAQDNGQMGQSNQGQGSATSYQQEDRDTNWSWLGLIGLAGLAGLRRPAPTVVHQDRDGTARSH